MYVDDADRPRFERLTAYFHQLNDGAAPPDDADIDTLEALVQTGARGLLSRFISGQVRHGGLSPGSLMTRLSLAACRPDVSLSDLLIGLLELWQTAIEVGERDGDFLALADPDEE